MSDRKICLHCRHTGWIHTEDDMPDQICPYCFVGKAVYKCYHETITVQIGNHEQLKAELKTCKAFNKTLKNRVKWSESGNCIGCGAVIDSSYCLRCLESWAN